MKISQECLSSPSCPADQAPWRHPVGVPNLGLGHIEVVISKFSLCSGLRPGWNKEGNEKTKFWYSYFLTDLEIQNMCSLSYIPIMYKPFELTWAAAWRKSRSTYSLGKGVHVCCQYNRDLRSLLPGSFVCSFSLRCPSLEKCLLACAVCMSELAALGTQSEPSVLCVPPAISLGSQPVLSASTIIFPK